MLNIGRSDLRFFCENFFYRHASEYLEPLRAKCGANFFAPPLGKSLKFIGKIEGLSLVDRSFAPRDSPRPLEKKLAVSPSYTVNWGQYDTISFFHHPLARYCERHSWGREFRAFNVDQPVGSMNY